MHLPGAIPALNLPVKSIPSSSPASKPCKSADAILDKKSSHASFLEPSGLVEQQFEYYKSFGEFATRARALKLAGWNIPTDLSSSFSFPFADHVHMVPK